MSGSRTEMVGAGIRFSAALAMYGMVGASVMAIDPILAEDRLISWRPGVEGGIPAVETRAKVRAVDLRARDAATVIQQAIDGLQGTGAVQLPEGRFTLSAPLRLKSGAVLRGAGPDKTHLVFDLPETTFAGAIQLHGRIREAGVPVDGTVQAASRTIATTGDTRLAAGQTILLFSVNDPDLMYTRPEWNEAWAGESPGQLLRVIGASDGVIETDTEVRLTHEAGLNPRISIIEPIAHAGVEDLSLARLDRSEDYIIGIQNAVNCWVRNIASDTCMRGHVWIDASRFVTVSDSIFHHAYDYGDGGHGYGVVAGKHATDCLVVNNAFRHLRHSMMVKQGANGNVFAYNYSDENVGGLCDISIHGHYSYMNLFEGNDVQFIKYADYWGPTGPLTTSFRNRVVSDIEVTDHSHRANVVGNTLVEGAVRVDESCEEVFVVGNRIGGTLTGPDPRMPASLFLDRRPPFWGDRPWPGIGADVDDTDSSPALPAERRLRAGD